MKERKTTKELILRTLSVGYKQSWTSDEFFELLNFFDIETYGQKEGAIIDGVKIDFTSLGLSKDIIPSFEPQLLTSDEQALLDEYYTQIMENEERERRELGVTPDVDPPEKELVVENPDAREEELEALRGKEEKGLDQDLNLQLSLFT